MQGTSKWIILSMLGETMLLVLVSLYTYSTNSLEEIKGLLPLVNFLSIAILLIVLFSIKKLEEMVKKEAEMMAVKDNLSQTESLLKTLQSQRHEYNRHLQTLQAMIHLGATQDAIEYLDGISLQNFPSEDMVYVGDPILTALLNSKGKVAESKNIKFDFAIKCDLGGLPFSSWELSSVLGNLLDNAFEAVLLNDWKHRSVGLEIKEEQGIYIIYVCNNGPTIPKEEEERVFKAGYTTKGSQGRGYGLFLVRNIIESYGGRIQMISNRRTLFKCYIPGKEGFYGQGIFKKVGCRLGE